MAGLQRTARAGAAGLILLLASSCGSSPTGSPSASPSSSSSSSSQGPTAGTPSSSAPAQQPSAAGAALCGEDPCLSVSFSGDFLLHPRLWAQAEADAAGRPAPVFTPGVMPTTAPGADLDFTAMIAAQKPYLAQADLSLCQMETPLAPASGPFSGYPMFNVPPQILTAAKKAGYDACTTASNHSIDAGTEGVLRTRAALDAAGIKHTGTNASRAESEQPLIMTVNGVKVSVITGTYGLNGMTADEPWRVDMLDAEQMIAKAKKARELGAEIVIANIHAGDEYASAPNEQQRTVAHALVDSGQFTMVSGQHTHSVLPIEKYKGTWIVYGLGNNLTELSPTFQVNNEGIMVNAVFTKKNGAWGVSTLRWAPSLMVEGPYRWCPVGSANPAPSCAPSVEAAASRARTAETVNSLGADKAGAKEWTVSK